MQNLLPVVARCDLLLKHGEGSYVYDEKDNKYLDFISGVASNPFGYKDKELEDFACDQIRKLTHVSNYFRSEELEVAAEKITRLTIGGKVFFVNSGTEAVETMIKIIRKHFFTIGKPEKNEIICFKNSFHGRTLGSLAAMGNEKYLEGFEPRLQGFSHAILNDIESVKSLISQRTAGIILEPIQGEGGVASCDLKFLQEIRKICDENDLILGFDEVQCGLSRSGKFSAFEHYDIKPDIITNAKALGGGIIPIGSCVALDKFCAGMTPGTHGSTFGGNPVAAGVASYVLDRISNQSFLDHVVLAGQKLRNAIEVVQNKTGEAILEIRGKGLMLGIKFNDKVLQNTDFVTKARENFLLLAPSSKDNVVRVLPRLNITDSEIGDFTEKLEKTIGCFL